MIENIENERGDMICEEADGCPTEGAVLKRAWREHRAEIERLEAAIVAKDGAAKAYYQRATIAEAEIERLRSDNALLKAVTGIKADT